MESLAQLKQEIEQKRSQLLLLSSILGLSSKLVLIISQELDELLNTYEHLKNEV
ncbi:Spo0E family sporulation regulatory protein-aspartic acid phosphatase [Paenibacillus marinisediminis]